MICETCLKTLTYIFYDTNISKFLCEECYEYLNWIDTTNIPQFY